jgi:hypothetical protein
MGLTGVYPSTVPNFLYLLMPAAGYFHNDGRRLEITVPILFSATKCRSRQCGRTYNWLWNMTT